MRRTQEVFEEALFAAQHWFMWGTLPDNWGELCPAAIELVVVMCHIGGKSIRLLNAL